MIESVQTLIQRDFPRAGCGMWVPALILAALIAWFFASNRPEHIAQQPVKPTTQNLMLAGVDVGKEIVGKIAGRQGANRQGRRSDRPAVARAAENSCGIGQSVYADCQPAV